MAKEKKTFKMPHLLWIMMGLVIICSILTYIIPAGEFAVDENGAILGTQFAFLGYQTPVNPIRAILNIHPGLTGSAAVIFVVMICGASIEIFLGTKSFDRFMDWAIYKLQGKNDTVMIVTMFGLMLYLGAFGGSDALIAIVPVGIVFAKKLKLDQICALGVALFAPMIGFATGPTKTFVVQGLMGTRPYGAFLSRFLIMNIFLVISLVMLLSYVRRIRKNPTKSLMYAEGWRPVESKEIEETKQVDISWQTFASLFLFIGQYVFITIYGILGDPTNIYAVTAAVSIVVAIIIGLISKMSFGEIGNLFAKGLANMAFVGFVIGMARTVSIVLTDGNILHTMVYALTIPLMKLPRWISTIGMTLVIALINPIIPSATSKAAILVPIIKPIGEVLQLKPEVVIQAFQFGDGFTNIVSPVLGWTVGGLAMAGVPVPKWVEWAMPKVLGLLAFSCLLMFVLTVVGWTGAI